MSKPTLYYIFVGASFTSSSVQNKVQNQIKELNKSFDCKGLFFTHEISEVKIIDNDFIFIPLIKSTNKKKYFDRYNQLNYTYTQIKEYVAQNIHPKSKIFIRHTQSTKQYLVLLKTFAKQLILYIPSNSIKENYHERFFYSTNAGIISKAFNMFEYYFYIFYWENKLIKKCLSKLLAVVVFTPEFATILQKQSNKKINTLYNRDGANPDLIPIRNPKTTGNIKLLFMKGSSMAQPWSGLDRLINSIDLSKRTDIELFITGSIVEKYKKYAFVNCTGKLSEVDLSQLVNKVDLGVSNLANYLIDFNETTNLKSRDYFLRGLPFIQSNTMPDIENTKLKAYYLLVKNDNSTINIEEIVNFALNFRLKLETSTNMRNLALQTLTWESTVAELSNSILTL